MVKSRPLLYISKEEGVDGFQTFLHGFLVACNALGYRYSSDAERRVLLSAGYERRADGVWSQMQEKGMSDEEMIHQGLVLEIQKWKEEYNLGESD
jgi:hypothetical protein